MAEQTSRDERKILLTKLISFYKDYVSGSAKAVDTLADIHGEFQEDYETIKRIKSDPTLINQIMANLSEKEKETFLLILIKTSMLGEKMNNLFDLSVDEKRELAGELRNFSEFVDNAIKEILEERETRK